MSEEEGKSFWPVWSDIPSTSAGSSITELEKEHLLTLIANMKPPPVEPQNFFLPPVERTETTEVCCCCVDEISLHTYRLRNCSYELNRMLAKYRDMEFDSAEEAQKDIPPALPLPQIPDCIIRHRRPGDITGRDRDSSDFVKGRGTAPPLVEKKHLEKMMKNAVIVLFQQVGFDVLKQSATSVCISLFHEFLLNITKLLRKNVDEEALTGNPIQIDVLEKTMHDLELGSVPSLHYFYQRSVVDPYYHILEKCETLTKEYEKLRNPINEPEEEDMVDKMRYPGEIHFPEPPPEDVEDSQILQVPFPYEELHTALQHEPEGSNCFKDDTMNWPPTESTRNDDSSSAEASGDSDEVDRTDKNSPPPSIIPHPPILGLPVLDPPVLDLTVPEFMIPTLSSVDPIESQSAESATTAESTTTAPSSTTVESATTVEKERKGRKPPKKKMKK